MLIDRSNYEVWLIDWLDGNLSNHQLVEVMSFLKDNPDIKEEFNELASLSLKPQETKFRKKDLLKKLPKELSESQFEYLSVAFLENDLKPAQVIELKEMIEADPEKARTHELIQKTRLKPAEIIYVHKYQLIRSAVKQRVIRLSNIGLGVAATVALVIISYMIVPHSNTDDAGRDGMQSVATTIPIVDTNGTHYATTTTKPDVPSDGSQSVSPTKPDMPGDGKFSASATTPYDDLEGMNSVSAKTPNANADGMHTLSMGKIIFQPNIDLKIKTLNNALITSTFVPSVPSFDDERSNIGRFIARNFRQRLLKEKNSKDTPLKVYEIAEAGVSGLNKLLGWQMALNTVKNEIGEPASVYFTSKLLKFNTPVKKTQTLP